MKIKQLHIYTHNLKGQTNFYTEVLELPVKQLAKNRIKITLGFSEIIMEEKREAKPYHIAFHIPPSKAKEALQWLEPKVKILPFENKPIIDFTAWKAKSVYFYDEDHNIVELISRENLFAAAEVKFDANQILGVAEIGLVTDNILEKFNFLQQEFELDQYDGNLQEFCPIGDDMGLLITINHKLKKWFPTDDKAYVSDFKIIFQHHKRDVALQFKNNNLSKIND